MNCPTLAAVALGAAILFLLFAPASEARLVDEFMDSSTVISASTTMDSPFILGGERDVLLNPTADFQTLGGAARLEVFAGGIPIVGLRWDGNDDSTAANFGLSDIDLTDGGLADRFVLELVEVVGSIDVRVRVLEDASNISLSPQTTITAAGRYEFPFANFTDVGAGADLTQAHQVELSLFSIGDGDVIEIDRLATTGVDAIDPYRAEQPAATSRIDDDPQAAGGERDIRVNTGCGGTMEISDGALRTDCNSFNNGDADIVYDGDDNSHSLAAGLMDIDLTGGGQYERLRFYVSEVTGPVGMSLRVDELGGAFLTSETHFISEPGIYDFPYRRFLNVGDMSSVDLIAPRPIVQVGEAISIDHIELVPPPPIDAFEGGPPIVSAGASQQDAAIVGAERDVVFHGGLVGTFDVGGGEGRLDVTSNDGSKFELSYDGFDGSSGLALRMLEDLTRGGRAAQLNLEISDINAANASIRVVAGAGLANSFEATIPLDAGAGTYCIPFSAFSVQSGSPDFEITNIIVVETHGLTAGDSITFESIDVGPLSASKVPSAGRVAQAVLGLALLALGVLFGRARDLHDRHLM